jgi:hypothetical protein
MIYHNNISYIEKMDLNVKLNVKLIILHKNIIIFFSNFVFYIFFLFY